MEYNTGSRSSLFYGKVKPVQKVYKPSPLAILLYIANVVFVIALIILVISKII